MKRGLLSTAMLLAAFTGSGAGAAEYKGICEASAGAFIDGTHFAVASDETNKLQIYERGKPQPIGNGIDMETFTSFDKSDLEAAAVIGDRIYWMSSHSFNSQGEDKAQTQGIPCDKDRAGQRQADAGERRKAGEIAPRSPCQSRRCQAGGDEYRSADSHARGRSPDRVEGATS